MQSETAKTRQIPLEPVGKRIARLRAVQGWTQQALATRLAISRVAVSLIEMDLSVPSERTITLLAGIFKLTPHELIEGTLYPAAKADRLPDVACCYTKLELNLALLQNDLDWLERLNGTGGLPSLKEAIRHKWLSKLAEWSEHSIDEGERENIAAAQKKLAAACKQ